ncbi:hypothetical protein EJB05_50952, partial [Eragrostis curvula]
MQAGRGARLWLRGNTMVAVIRFLESNWGHNMTKNALICLAEVKKRPHYAVHNQALDFTVVSTVAFTKKHSCNLQLSNVLEWRWKRGWYLSDSQGLTNEGIPFWSDCLDLVSLGPPSPRSGGAAPGATRAMALEDADYHIMTVELINNASEESGLGWENPSGMASSEHLIYRYSPVSC